MRIFGIIASTMLPFAVHSAGSAAASEKQQVAISDSQSAALTEAIRRGELIYLYDQTAWHSTDALLEDIKDSAKAGIRGWIVVPTDKELEFRAIYYGRDEDGTFEIYSASWDGSQIKDRRVSQQTDKIRLPDEANRLIAALDRATKERLHLCNKLPANTIVLPRLDPSLPDSVYILTPQPNASSYPLGGHTRFDIKDGNIVQQRRFANSCLTMTKEGEKAGEETVSFFATHVLDEVPTEIHVFTMLTSLMPISVMTVQSDLLWSIGRENGKVIYDVDRLPPREGAK